MKKWGMVLIVSSLLLFCGRSEGQVANYVFTTPPGTYTNLSGGTEVTLLEDDDAIATIPIGFTFTYNGSDYTQALISSNGWLSFNTSLIDPTYVNSLANSNAIRPALYPLWDDLDGFWEGLVYYQTTGSLPNRVLTVEWRKFDWQLGASDDVISFQIKLFESTNVIQFIYRQELGAVYSGSPPLATIGISGTASGDYLTLNNSSGSPTPSSSTFYDDINTKPANNQVYQFAPPACSGTPALGGTTASTANPVCYNTSFTLSVSGSSSGYSGLTYQWQSSPDGTTWTNIGGATSTTYTTSISTSTYFRRIITCVGSNNSSSLQVIVQKPTTSATPSSVCVNSSSVLTASASAGTSTLLSENFNGAAAGWTTFNFTSGGIPANAAWTVRPNGYVYTSFSSYTFNSNDNSQFYLTNADAAGSGVTTVSTILQSPVFSTVGYSSASLQFYHHFRYLGGETADVQISTNGTSWSSLQVYTATVGGTQSFVLQTISLNSYLNNATVYIRFKYDAGWDWWWAVDNVTITGTPSATTYAWTASPAAGAGLPAGAGTLSAANSSISVTPTTVGNITYTVSTNNSCLSPASVVVASTTGGPTTSTTCLSRTVSTGDNYFVNGTCNLLAKIVPQGGATALSGTVNVCARLESGTTFYNAEPYLMRHFDIEPSSNPSTATARVTVYVLQTEFDDYNTNCGWFPKLPINSADVAGYKANLRITQCHGTYSTQPLPGYYSGSPVLIDPVDTDIFWNATTTCWEISFDVTGFSGFFIHTSIFGYPLSAQFISLTGKREGGGNILKWKVPNEQNIRGYEMERSYDGQNFTSIGFVNSQAPGGNSAAELQYSFTDNYFTGDKQYYRLKQTGIDGSIKISSVVLVKSSMPASLILSGVFPNPASHFVNLMIESPVRNELTVLLSDINGRILQTKKIIAEQGSTVIPFNTEQLAGGTYLIKVICANGCENAVKRFVKQ